MVRVAWKSQTVQIWDPLSTILTIPIRIGDVELEIEGVFDTGADWTDLQPPAIGQFGIDEDQHGFATIQDNGIVVATIPVAMATARLDGQEFPLPVTLYPNAVRPTHVFGRAGLLDHFHVTLDPVAGETTLEWRGPSEHSRLAEIQRLFIDERIGRRHDWLGRRVQ